MNDLILGNSAVAGIVDAVKNLTVIKPEHMNFLQVHREHLASVLENTHMWRTDTQKRSILSDHFYPTIHSKFHQAILEQKVQFDQAMYLAKDFELKKLEIEESNCDLEEVDATKRGDIKSRKIKLEIQFKQYELKNMQIAMDYRMKEVMGWQAILDDLLSIMRKENISEEAIWNKNNGEITSMFFSTLNNLQGLENSNDGAERNNLVSLASFAVKQAKQAGIFDTLKTQLNETQLKYLKALE